MSDPDEIAPDESPRSERETLDRAVSEVRERRSNPLPDAPAERDEPAPVKLTDGKADELSPRKAGRLLSELRAQELERARGYQAAAEASDRMAGPNGRAGDQPADQPDPDLDAQSDAARLETERQALAEAREIQARIGSLEGVERDLATKLQHALPAFHEQFADIKSLADVEALQRNDPQRFAQFSNYSAALANGMQQLEALGKERFTTAKASFDQQAEAHDSYFSQAHPELSDRSRATEVGDAVRRLLSDLGIGKDELEPLWDGRQTFSLRDFRAQELLYKAAMYELGQTKLEASRANGRFKELPSVNRPGVRGDSRADSAQAALERAERALARNPANLKAGAELLKARRAAGRL